MSRLFSDVCRAIQRRGNFGGKRLEASDGSNRSVPGNGVLRGDAMVVAVRLGKHCLVDGGHKCSPLK